MGKRRMSLLVGGVLVVALLAGIAVIGPSDFFLPERPTQVAETPVDDGAEVVKRGTFVGAAGHDVRGTVLLMRDGEGLYLRFEDYMQTQGPDVFVYATPSPTPDTSGEITQGTKILIDSGADGGESTKEGTFTQRLPKDIHPDDIGGVGIWCERFATPFGYANLSAEPP